MSLLYPLYLHTESSHNPLYLGRGQFSPLPLELTTAFNVVNVFYEEVLGDLRFLGDKP